MEILKDRYTITELSEILKTTDHALRYYEKEFNLTIPKDDRGRRYYTPEHANIMFKIRAMRNEGLQIKAIRKILEEDSSICEPPPVVSEANTLQLTRPDPNSNSKEILQFFEDFKETLAENISIEVNSVREDISKEINKSKLELGACIENSIRKLETKMEKHFTEVDRSIGQWRQRKKRSFFKRIFNKNNT